MKVQRKPRQFFIGPEEREPDRFRADMEKQKADAAELLAAQDAKLNAFRRRIAKEPIQELPGGLIDARPRRLRGQKP